MSKPRFVFVLCVAGDDERARATEGHVRQVCEAVIPEDFCLTTINVVDSMPDDLGGPILATPTLMRLAPGPTRRFVGDLVKEPHLLSALLIRE